MRYLLLSLALILIVINWPVQIPTTIREPEANPVESASVTSEQSLSFEVKVPPSTRNISGLTLWTDPDIVHTPNNTSLILQVNPPNSDSPLTINSKLHRILKYQQLVWTWRPIDVQAGDQLSFTLQTTDQPSRKELPIRYAIYEPPAQPRIALNMYTKTPLIRALLLKIFEHNTAGEDIFYTWQEGKKIIEGGNPYSAVTELGDRWDNHKYATYLPLFYWLSAATQKLGLTDYDEWVAFWQPVLLLFAVSTAGLLFGALYSQNKLILALAAVFFVLFNRWSIYIANVAHIDFIALFFLVASYLSWQKHHRWSLIFLGLSLAIKQMAVFIIPLYLIWVWQRAKTKHLSHTLRSLGLIISIPLLVSLPFLLDDPSGFISSILISVSRIPAGDFSALSLDAFLGLPGISSRFFMFGLVFLVYLASYRRQISKAGSIMFIFMILTSFNSVIFSQYFLWALPFIPLAISEWSVNQPERNSSLI